MNKRALLIALIVAAVGASLLLLYLRRFEQQASGGERVKLLMAMKPMDRGTTITDEMLAVREVPIAYVEDRAVKATERQKVVGLRVGNLVQPQQTLMWTDLAIASDERRDLSSLIQPGNRGVTVKASSEDKSFALIRPGDYVDVIATMPTGGTADTRTSIVLLQKVLVLALGLETAPETFSDGKDSKASGRDLILTLSLDLRETQLLSLATEKGKLAVALRNPDDPRVFTSDQNPDMSSTVLTDPKTRSDIGKGRPGGPVKLTTPGANK